MLSNMQFDDELKFLSNIGLGARPRSIKRISRKGNESEYDCLLIEQSVLRYYFLLWDLLTELFSHEHTMRVLHTFISQYANSRHAIKATAFAADIALLSEACLQAITVYDLCIPPDFKHQVLSKANYRWLFLPLWQVLTRPNYAVVRQLGEYLARVKLISTAKELEADEIQRYISAEEEMRLWSYPTQLTTRLKEILNAWFPIEVWKQECGAFVPSLGPGAPAGETRQRGGNLQWKYSHMCVSPSLFRGSQYLDSSINAYFPPWVTPTRDETWKVCELVYVPKSATKLRSISKEPVSLQYLQHGWADVMYRTLRRTEAGRHICLERQELSQRMALQGSVDGSLATIDLSAASDSVTLSLVRQVFPEHVRSVLLACRSTDVVLPNGMRLQLAKYAPMGSTLCFITETVVFAAICQLAADIKGIRGTYRVYGDDIIVQASLADTVISLLTALHFTVNKKKSYWDNSTLFREACGIEAIKGQIITPIRLSRHRCPSLDCHVVPGDVGRLTDEANDGFRHGYLSYRRWILHEASRQRLPKEFTKNSGLPDDLLSWMKFDDQGLDGIIPIGCVSQWRNANHALKAPRKLEYKRTHRTYLPFCYDKAIEQRADDPTLKPYDLIAYFEWLRSHSVKTEQVSHLYEVVKPSIGPTTVSLAVRWA